MEQHGTTYRKFLLAGILLFLLLPLVQHHLGICESEKLNGALVPAQKEWFSVRSWWSGRYQEAYEKWFNENFGFRNDLVRMHNQIAYSVYGKAKANGVVIGKDGYLFEENYVLTYTGKDFVGMNVVEQNTDKLKQLQDSLEQRGVTLLVCLAAGKASYFPEFIPDEYGKAADTTNYQMYADAMRRKNINLVDCNSWFRQMKATAQYPLYPKTGIHWSRYGSMLVLDSLIHYVEKKRNVDMPGIVWEGVEMSDSLRSPDDDIGLGMNLTWPLQGYAMAYPKYHFEDTTGKANVKLMTISDSFFWTMFDINLSPSPFNGVEFYYYNKEVYHTDGRDMSIADIETTMDDVQGHDVVMIMGTEATMFGFGWGFIDDAFNHFVAHKMVKSEDRLIRKYESLIRMDEAWMKAIYIKADEHQISVDSMIYLDAKFMADEEMRKAGEQ